MHSEHRKRLMSMSNDTCWNFHHPMNHRSPRLESNLRRSSSDWLELDVIHLLAIAGRRETKSPRRCGYSSQGIDFQSNNRTTIPEFLLQRNGSLDGELFDFCVLIELEPEWCSETIDTVEWCKWQLLSALMCRLFLRHMVEHASVERRLKKKCVSTEMCLAPVSYPTWCHLSLLPRSLEIHRLNPCDQSFPMLTVVVTSCFDSTAEIKDNIHVNQISLFLHFTVSSLFFFAARMRISLPISASCGFKAMIDGR